MDPIEAVRRCGGRASIRQLRAAGVRHRDLHAAVRDGHLVRSRRGRYRLADLAMHLDVAIELTATLSHRSAALHHGLEVATAPELPEVMVRRNRNLTDDQRRRATVRWRDLPPEAVHEGVTTVIRTVLDCARDLPFTEALAVADAALRRDLVDVDRLRAAAAEERGPGAPAARRVALAADGMAANPFESALRALALDAGLQVQPQVQVTASGLFAMVDLADEGRRLVVEAESFEFHATRRGFRKDVRRYSELVVFGWTVLRFTWEDVMFQPGYVRWALESWRRSHDAGARVPAPPAHLPRLA